MKITKSKIILVTGLLILVLGLAAVYVHQSIVTNPRVINELRAHPEGERAARTMLVTLPDGRVLPVNYLQEINKVYIGVDGRWWRLFVGEGAPVQLEIKNVVYTGHARAIVDDQDHTNRIFKRLRPTVPAWLPDALNGVLVEVDLDHH